MRGTVIKLYNAAIADAEFMLALKQHEPDAFNRNRFSVRYLKDIPFICAYYQGWRMAKGTWNESDYD